MEDLKNTREMTLVAEAYTRYRTLLVAYANKRTRNLADAEDVVQEAFIKIINMGDMVYAATIRNLAFTTVQNLLIDRLRRRVVVSEVHSYIYDIQPELTKRQSRPFTRTVCCKRNMLGRRRFPKRAGKYIA